MRRNVQVLICVGGFLVDGDFGPRAQSRSRDILYGLHQGCSSGGIALYSGLVMWSWAYMYLCQLVSKLSREDLFPGIAT